MAVSLSDGRAWPIPDEAWRHGAGPRHPGPYVTAATFDAYYEPAAPEVRKRNGKVAQPAQPFRVRLTGPLGGSRIISDPHALVDEARRLLDVAATLRRLQRSQAQHEARLAAGEAPLPLPTETR